MRHAALYLFFLFPLIGYAAPSDPTCAVETETYNSKEVLCTIPQTAEPRSYEFTARFSGGHDDTRASIKTTLDAKPLACEDGSKKELFGEDGDVSLLCRFVVSGMSGSQSQLRVTIRWSHAEYTDFRLAGP